MKLYTSEFQWTQMYRQICQRLLNTSKSTGLLQTSVLLQKSALHKSETHRFITTTMTLANKKVAVVLSGSGVYDGTEINEAAACLAALTRHGAIPIAYSLDKTQHHVIAHNCGEGLYQSNIISRN